MENINSKVINRINEKKIIKVICYIVLFVVLFGTSNASIYSAKLAPFAIGIVFSLLSIGFSGYYLSIVFALAYILARWNFNSLVVTINVVAILLILQFVIDRYKFKLCKWKVFVAMLTSQIAYIICGIGSAKENLALFVSIVLGVFFLYACLCFFSATFNRGMLIKLNIDEKICGCLILMVFMAGMTATNIGVISLGLMIGALTILMLSYSSSAGGVIVLSSVMGIGASFVNINTTYISMYVFMALVSIAFKCNIKILSPIAISLSYIIFNLFFDIGISIGGVISVIIGGIVYLLVPKKYILSFVNIFAIKKDVLLKSVLDKNRIGIIKRIKELSLVFDEMDKVYRQMVRGVLPEEKALDMIKCELKDRCCAGCEYYDTCYRASGSFLENSLDIIVSTAYEKNKILLIDVPQYLTTNCSKVNLLLSHLNNIVSSYKDYTSSINNLDISRVLIADQLNGVSKLLLSLSKEIDYSYNFDNKLENKIKEELSYKNIICLDAMVYEKNATDKNIELIVKNDIENDNEIEKTVTKLIGKKMRVLCSTLSEIPNANVITLSNAPNYDIVFGSSSISKFGERFSGDNHSIIKISDGKFMLSICDGMGSGARAKKMSDLTINLIENFYKAQFDNDNIISSVNKLLSLTEEENFSTIDLCVIDCKQNYYDFIKLGAVNGYIKHSKSGVEIIESSSLPIGVIEDIRPHIIKRLISPMDIIVLVSDGISDAFEGNDFVRFLSSLDIVNPQTLSEEILSKALEFTEGIAKDDMTVVCARIFEYV